MQTVPNATWTKVEGSNAVEVFQRSGATSWVNVDLDRRITFGPADEWIARHPSGTPIDLTNLDCSEPITVDWL